MIKHLLLTLLLALPLTVSADDTQGATNKSKATATELTQGKTIAYNYVQSDGIYFYWKFTITETGTISLIVKRSNSKNSSFLAGSIQTELVYAKDDETVVKLAEIKNSDTLTFENARPGQYYVRADFNLLKSCTYKLTYKFTPGSTTPDDGDGRAQVSGSRDQEPREDYLYAGPETGGNLCWQQPAHRVV